MEIYRIYDNGVYRDMTEEEEKEYLEFKKQQEEQKDKE